MEFKKIHIGELKHASYNLRKDLKPGDAEFEKIKNSINEFGYVEPVIVNQDMTIVGGHQRAKVLKALGYTEIDCVVIDVDKNKEKALNVALNKITGQWDFEALSKLLNELKEKEYNIELTGFDFSEAEKLWNEYLGEDTTEFEEDELPESVENPVIQAGDIIKLGKHRLICGDATSLEDITKLMDGKKAKLIVTDPPYGISYVGKTEDALTIQDDTSYFFNFIRLKNLYYTFKIKTENLILHKNYRSTYPIVNLINKISEARRQYISTSKYDYTQGVIRKGWIGYT